MCRIDQTKTNISISFTLSLLLPLVSLSNQFNIPIVCDPFVVPNAPKDSPPPSPLQLYSRQTSHCSPDDSFLVPTPPPPLTLIVEPDIPIVIRKGICYICNPSPHYTII